MKKLLMLGTSYASCEMVKYAKSIGVYTIVTDYLPPEKSVAKLVSDEYWMINTSEVDELEAKCRAEGVTGVCCGISEFNLEMAMELSKRLGLKCYCTPEAWQYSKDKSLFKKLCRQNKVPIAKDFDISDEDNLSCVHFPVVVKPVDLSANRGISYCNNEEELRNAIVLAKKMSRHPDKIVCERMLHGEEWYSMYAIANGAVRMLSLCAMYAQPGEPKNCYTITTTVSDHVAQYISEINPAIERLLREVGVSDGIAWVQTMLDEDGHFYVIEMGYRMDGEMMFMPLKDVCGFDTIKWLVETALGIEHSADNLPAPQTGAFEKCACGMYLWINRGGIIKQIEGFDEISKEPGVFVETLAQIDDQLDRYRAVGVITFATENCDKMCELIQKVNDVVHVYNENGEDMIIKYTDFEYLKHVYAEGLAGR